MRRARVHRSEFIRVIYIYRHSEALHLPVSGNLYFAPLIRQLRLGIPILEIPVSVQARIRLIENEFGSLSLGIY